MGRTVGRQGRRAWTRRSLVRICRDAASLHAPDSAIVALLAGGAGSCRTSSRRRPSLNVVRHVRPIPPDARFHVGQFAFAVFEFHRL